MINEIGYIFILLAVICVSFTAFKRPIYECMFYGYMAMVICTGEIANVFTYIVKTSKDTLFYSIIAFLVLGKILDMTHAVDAVIALMLSIFGKIRGGAGYTAVLASAFMGALSGSGAGNVATTGVFTIPAMIKSGFPRHLAANIECAASTMGNMIPPAGVIVAALACYNEFSGAEMEQSTFWLAMWGVAIWFVLQRIITVYAFCRFYRVTPMDTRNCPNVKDILKEGWPSLLIPVIILSPFVLDYFLKSTLFAARLGDGAKSLSSSLLMITPGIAAVYALAVSHKKMKFGELTECIAHSVSGIVPVGATIFFSYCISNLFSATAVGETIGAYVQTLNLSFTALAFALPLITLLLGMVLPGSAQTKIFGSTIIAVYAAAGGNPLLAAVMLPVITGAMEGMTPPLALCMYAAMGIAESNMKDTITNNFIWIALHYMLSVLCLLGILPVFGV